MTTKSISQTLYAAADLLSGEGKWTQGVHARGKSGKEVTTRKAATCFCAIGALSYVSGGAPHEEMGPYQADRALLKVINFEAIADWNDNPTRTQSEVVAKLREAGDLAKGRGL